MAGQPASRREKGQILALFAIVFIMLVAMVGLVIDGGYGLAQRREAQNAADFAALAGARIIAEKIGGDTVNGTDDNVMAAIETTAQANGAEPVPFGAGGPVYVDVNGAVLDYVGNGSIPDAAVGVRVTTSRTWHTFFIGVVGISNWTASASATARGGYAAGAPAGIIFPAGIAEAYFNERQPCSGDVTGESGNPCHPQQFSNGTTNVPGGFGWLKLGCAGYGLGQNGTGCSNAKTFLQSEIDPGADTHGCCTQVGLPGSPDRIGSLPGNKVSADCSYWINSGQIVTVPVWDYAGGSGENAWYHIVGYTGFQVTDCHGGAGLDGVWRQPFWNGATTTTPGFAGQPLAVELIR